MEQQPRAGERMRPPAGTRPAPASWPHCWTALTLGQVSGCSKPAFFIYKTDHHPSFAGGVLCEVTICVYRPGERQEPDGHLDKTAVEPLTVSASVSLSCLTLWDPPDCSLPGSSVHRILQTRLLERVAISSSRGSS